MPHWHLASLGGAEGTARLDEREVRVTSGSSRRFEVGRTLEIDADSGKFADSEDGFIFCYRMVDPSAENFRISATVTATKSAAGADQQSGCGIMLVDSDTGTDERACHRNSLLLGRFGRMRTLGVRIVAGHVDRDCFEPSNARILDESRAFPGDGGEAFFGVPKTLSAEKTDGGFVLACDGQRIEVPGCDFLMVQDPSSVCVGFAVARGVRMEIDDIRFEVWSGAASHTPDGVIESSVPDYPFTRSIVADAWAGVSAPGEALPQVCYVAPAGRPEASGSEDDPTTIERALSTARPGMRIVLRDGSYHPKRPLVIAAERSGTMDEPIMLEAERSRKACIDGSCLAASQPLLVVDADFWHVEGLVLCNSPLSGLTVFGSMNRIVNCEASANGDTGILVISRPGAARPDWPRHNLVKDCDSHHNCDSYCCNADGFGAKLRVGEGNVFYRCIAYNNIDDGFDLYTKSSFGPIGSVELDSCVAYQNGILGDGDASRTKPGGIGFKLGGEEQAVAHEVWNCLAVGNVYKGFSANSNPLGSLHFCTSVANGKTARANVDLSSKLGSRWSSEGILTARHARSLSDLQDVVKRDQDGCLVASSALAPRQRLGKRLGASLGMRKNILMFASSIGGDGARRVACTLANELSVRHNVCLLCLDKKDEENCWIDSRVTKIDAAGVAYDPHPKRAGLSIAEHVLSARRLLLLMRTRARFDIDTTISFSSTPNFLNALSVGGYRIVCERDDPSQQPSASRWKAGYSCRHANYVVFQTSKVEAMFPQSVREKSCIIHDPVTVSCHATSSCKKFALEDVIRAWERIL